MCSAASGDLGRAGEVQLVALDRVDVDLVRREEAGAVHGLLADEHGRQRRARSPARRAGRARSGRARARAARRRRCGSAKREPETCARALHVDAGRARGGRAARSRTRRLADAADLDGVVVRRTVRARSRRAGSGRGEQLVASCLRGARARSSTRCSSAFTRFSSSICSGVGLPLSFVLRAQLVDLRHERAPGARPPPCSASKASAAPLRARAARKPRDRCALPGCRSWRASLGRASSTCATPSSSADGQTKSAIASTRSSAFATATP